jgi:CBS domain containing-hemolysin-like protein
VDTVAGLILSKLGRLPRVGDSVRIRNLTLTVEAMRRRRIERVLLHRIINEAGRGGGVS